MRVLKRILLVLAFSFVRRARQTVRVVMGLGILLAMRWSVP